MRPIGLIVLGYNAIKGNAKIGEAANNRSVNGNNVKKMFIKNK